MLQHFCFKYRCLFNDRNLSISQRHFVLQEQLCHHWNDRQVAKATFAMRLNILMRLTSFLGVCHNLCSEFVLHIGRLKEISTTFRNSMKIALNFIVNINQIRNNHENTYFNLYNRAFLQIFGILNNACSISNFDISANIQLKS